MKQVHIVSKVLHRCSLERKQGLITTFLLLYVFRGPVLADTGH